MTGILDQLSGGDRRSIGRSNEVAAEVLKDPGLFGELFQGMLSADPLVRMRAADAIEKITQAHPEYLEPHKEALLGRVASIEQQEVRWHFAQIAPRLSLDAGERARLAHILAGFLDDRSRIVQTFALQALADLAQDEPGLRAWTVDILEQKQQSGSPAVKSRAQKLLKQLRKTGS